MRFTRARLTTFDDPQYRAYVQRMTMGRDNQRATRPPRQRDLFGGEAEGLLREWLTGQGLALSDRRILDYEERRGRSAVRKYRELDALVEQGRSLHIFEVKASRTANALRRAYGQLQEVRGALQLISPNVTTTLLLVDTGIPTPAEVAEMLRSVETPWPEGRPAPPTLEDVLADHPRLVLVDRLDQIVPGEQSIAVLRFSVADIVALAGDRPLHLDWAADDEEDAAPPGAPAEPPPPTVHTIGDDGDDDDNPFAAAFRRAQ